MKEVTRNFIFLPPTGHGSVGGKLERCNCGESGASVFQSFREQFGQLLECAFGLWRVVYGAVERRPTVVSVIVDFAFEFTAPGLKRAIELFNRLFRHAVVLDGVREIESRLDARQREVRACGGVGEESDAVKRSGGGDPVRTRSGDPHRHAAGDAVAKNAYGPIADSV